MKLKNFLKFNKSPQAQAGFSLLKLLLLLQLLER